MISSLPYLICWIWSLIVAWISDKLIDSRKISRAYVRKGTTAIGFFGAAAGLIGLTFIGCNPTWAIVLLCFAIAIEGTGYSGYMVNQLELSPNYAGTLKGTSSTFANICGFVSPALTGALTNGKVTKLLNKIDFALNLAVFQLSRFFSVPAFFSDPAFSVFSFAVFPFLSFPTFSSIPRSRRSRTCYQV